jgi:hypothetical protein
VTAFPGPIYHRLSRLSISELPQKRHHFHSKRFPIRDTGPSLTIDRVLYTNFASLAPSDYCSISLVARATFQFPPPRAFLGVWLYFGGTAFGPLGVVAGPPSAGEPSGVPGFSGAIGANFSQRGPAHPLTSSQPASAGLLDQSTDPDSAPQIQPHLFLGKLLTGHTSQ